MEELPSTLPARKRPPVGRWLTPAVLGFGLASFLSDAGHEAATSALPALLILLGSAPAALGIIEGVSDGLASFAKLMGGWWADRPHVRKPLAVGGYLATGLSVGLFGLATSWLHIVAARSVGWFARGVRGPVRDAMLADAVPPEAVGRAFGFHRAMDTAGAVVGPLLAMVLVATVPLRQVFFWAVIPGVLAALAFAVLVKRPAPRTVAVRPFGASLQSLPGAYWQFLVAVFLFGAGDFARTLLILRATQLLTPQMGAAHATATALALYAGHNVLYAAASYPVGRLADHFSPRKLLVVGYVLGTVTAVLAALATPSLLLLIVLFGVAGLTLAFEDTLEGTITAQMVAPEVRGTGYGALAATNGVGDLLSSISVGLLWSMAGPEVAFGLAAILCLGGTAILGFTRIRAARAELGG
jgi:MFS family permease